MQIEMQKERRAKNGWGEMFWGSTPPGIGGQHSSRVQPEGLLVKLSKVTEPNCQKGNIIATRWERGSMCCWESLSPGPRRTAFE